MSDGRDDTLLSTKEAAQLAGVNISTMREWGYKGWVPYTTVARQMRFARRDVELYLATRQQAPQPVGVQTALPWAAEAPGAKQPVRTPPVAQQPAPAASGPGELTLLRQALEALRRERDILQRELDAAYDRERVHLRLLEHVYQPAPRATSAHTLSQRCLEYLQQERTAKTTKEVQRALGVSRSPSRALRYLVDKGLIFKAGLAKFQAFPSPSALIATHAEAPPKKTVRPQTRRDRIVAYLRREARPRLAVQIKEALGLSATPYDDLARMEKSKGVVRKLRPGLWEAVYPEVQEES